MGEMDISRSGSGGAAQTTAKSGFVEWLGTKLRPDLVVASAVSFQTHLAGESMNLTVNGKTIGHGDPKKVDRYIDPRELIKQLDAAGLSSGEIKVLLDTLQNYPADQLQDVNVKVK